MSNTQNIQFLEQSYEKFMTAASEGDAQEMDRISNKLRNLGFDVDADSLWQRAKEIQTEDFNEWLSYNRP